MARLSPTNGKCRVAIELPVIGKVLCNKPAKGSKVDRSTGWTLPACGKHCDKVPEQLLCRDRRDREEFLADYDFVSEGDK